jgi:hypothetical protein
MPGLASEVLITQRKRGVRPIPTGSVTTLFMAAICERGPIGEATFAQDEAEWEDQHGGYIADGNGRIAAKGFFDGGGKRLYTSRIVHLGTSSDPTTKTSAKGSLMLQTEPLVASAGTVLGATPEFWSLQNGDDLDISIDGAGALTATFLASAATVTGANTGPFNLTDTWSFSFDTQAGTQTITLDAGEFVNIAAATPEEVAAVINAEAVGIQAGVSANAVTITTDKLGTGATLGSFADVNGTPLAVLGFTGLSNTGGGNVGDITAVTAAEAHAVVDAVLSAVADTVIEVVATSSADDEFGFDNATHVGTDAGAVDTLLIEGESDGDYINQYSPRITAVGGGFFTLELLRENLAEVRIPGLTMDPDSDRYVEKVVNEGVIGTPASTLIRVTDQNAAASVEDRAPAAGTFGPITGGDDGLSGLVDSDFSGGYGGNGRTGLRVFDALEADLLICPDRATSAVQNAMITYADITRNGQLFVILDPPAGLTPLAMVSYVLITADLKNATENAAIYYPRITITNPSVDVFGSDLETIPIPPSGHIAGLYARTDASIPVGGTFIQPAGTDIGKPAGMIGWEPLAGEAQHPVLIKENRELLFPNNINPISREIKGDQSTGIFLDGARNLDIRGNWPSVGQRRGAMWVEGRVQPGLAYTRHKNIKKKLRREAQRTVEQFLTQVAKGGELASEVPSEAFRVDFGDGLNTAATKKARTTRGSISLATNEPNEFTNIDMGPFDGALEAELAAISEQGA